MKTNVFGALLVLLGLFLIGFALWRCSVTAALIYMGIVSLYLGGCFFSASGEKGGKRR